jgi:hypothetical protein
MLGRTELVDLLMMLRRMTEQDHIGWQAMWTPAVKQVLAYQETFAHSQGERISAQYYFRYTELQEGPATSH